VTFEFSKYNVDSASLEPLGQVSGEQVAPLMG
jgi:hypothetical protein